MSDLAPFTLAILAGGKSSRMGQNKALLKIGERTIIEHVIALATTLNPAQTMLITNTPDIYAQLSLPMFGDVLLDQGTAGGILTALSYSQYDNVLVLPCDSPFIQASLLHRLIELKQSGNLQAVVPLKDDYPQSSTAIYDRACRSQFEASIHNDQRKMSTILQSIDKVFYLPENDWRSLDPDGLSFINVNTPQDLFKAQNLWNAFSQS